MTLGQRIHDLRKRNKLSQNELGKNIGSSGDLIGRYERDEVKPSIEVASNIADQLSVSLDYLMGKTDIELDLDIINRVIEIQTLPDSDKSHILYTLDNLLASVKTRLAYK